jgi:hypothetical protein
MKKSSGEYTSTIKGSSIMNWRLSMLLALVLMAAPLACDSEEQSTGPDITGTSDTGNTEEPDAGDTGSEVPTDAQSDTDPDPSDADNGDTGDSGDSSTPNGDAGDATFNPIDTNRPDPDASGPGVSGTCGEIEELGELAFGEQQFEFSFDVNNDGVRTSCRDLSATSKPEKIYKFQVSQRAILELTANPNTIFEVRTDPCGDESSIESCNPNGSLTGLNLSEGVDYYLIVEFEAEDVSGQDFLFNLNLQSVFTDCGPGQTTCASASAANVCNELGSYEEKSCPTGSCTDDACVGDTCANPIAVNSSASMQGDITAFSNKIRGFTACGTSGAGVRFLDGQEVVFLASQLQPNQTITVDASADAISNTIIIQRNACGASEACEHFDLAGGETLSHSVSRAGDYYIIIDGTDHASGSANYTVSIN